MGIRVLRVGYYVPARIVTNAEMACD
jgi:hypothetical protein